MKLSSTSIVRNVTELTKMSDQEVICFSELHSSTIQSDGKLLRTRFLFNLPTLEHQDKTKEVPQSACIDTDGDLDVSRRDTRFNLAVTIAHRNTSTLSQVGLQVWSGSLVMCDFLLSHPISIQEHVVVELGSGTGLTAIIAAHLASVVFATDNSAPVLRQCRDNIDYNPSTSLFSPAKVHVGLLDWKRGYSHGVGGSPLLQEFMFSSSQRELLSKSDVILACDTIYDSAGVGEFVCCINKLISETLCAKKIKLYLSLEKRINFSLSSLSAGSEPYDELFTRLEELRGTLLHTVVTWERIVLEHRQIVEYERSECLQLWVVSFDKIKV